MIRKKVKKEIEKTKRITEKFKKEFKKSVVTAIMAALGFIIALAWRDVITEFIEKIIKLTPVTGKLVIALIITFVATIIILIISKYSSTNE